VNQFTLRFTAQEVDQIANILAQRPFVEVHALLANIKQQVDQAQQAPQQRPQDVLTTDQPGA
jgi:hypothetical protein